MNWLEVKVDTAPAGLDAVSERLEALGVTGLVIDDEADFHDFLEHNHQYWDYVDDALMREKRGLSRVTFYLPDDADGEKLLSDARAALSALEDGAMVVASTGGASSPFTGGGHYLTLASVYEGKVYILDPYLKTDYSKTDKRHLLTQIEPGLLEADLEDIDELLLYTFYIIDTKEH